MSLKNIIRYICHNYPHSHELSNARLTKMIYLADWEYAKRHGKQLTEIRWFFDNYGPFVNDVKNEATADHLIDVIHTTTQYGTPKVLIKYKGDGSNYNISDEEEAVIEGVIAVTQDKYWNSFIKFVYDTYPIENNPRYTHLDLVKLAVEDRN